MNIEELKKEYIEIPLGRATDLSKQKFGKIQPLYRTVPPNQRGTYWVCQCDCGNIKIIDGSSLTTGRTKSCGCTTKIDKVNKYTKEQIGKIINHWKVINRDPNDNKKWIFECTCGSGFRKSMRIDSAKSSCGCPECSQALNKFIDLTGQKFGHWTVLEKDQSYNGHTMWKCQCDCETKTIKSVDAYKLKTGKSQSCGCQSNYSKGEEKIKKILLLNKIPFEIEKKFDTCKTSQDNFARFDFYVNNQYLIEYDGIQHFESVENGWNTEERYKRTKERDMIKNQWCKENNIPLIRIPYTHFDEICIEDLKLETSQFVI